LLVFTGAFFFTLTARAQTPELDRARATFAEAVADEDAGRTSVALEKFRHVAEVRDTTQVAYRIGTCLEALGKRRPALVAYDHAAHLGRGDARANDVVDAANARIAALAATMGKLALVVRGGDAAEVKVDGETIARDELAAALVVEPGEHEVDVTAPETKPVHAKVNVPLGRKVDLTVDLVPDLVAKEPAVVVSHTRRDFGIALLATGAAFAIGAGVTLLVRHAMIATIESDCPSNVCPIALHDDVERMRANAMSLEPVLGVLGGVALAAAAVGVVLVALGPQRQTIAVVPLQGGGALSLRGVF